MDEVLGQDSDHDRVPMDKVVLLIWSFRDDPSVVTFMARFVGKYAGSRHVFDGVEFYLPQLAHMIIHLEVEWDDAILERFALVIAQQSLHFALQFNWILNGALEDYRPELDNGQENPNYNALFYTRCLKLLKNVERCVVYGKPRAQELQRLYEQGKISKKEMVLLEQADRRFNALQITNEEDIANAMNLDGWFDVQLPFSSDGGFVSRFCSLERQVISIYKQTAGCGSKLRFERALSLEKSKISRNNRVIIVKTSNYSFKMRSYNEEELNLWERRLCEECQQSGLFHASSPLEGNIKKDLTAKQLDRYEFFHNERKFVENLTQLAEDLRDKDRSERKVLAPKLVAKLKIPETVYLPLCNSSDIWRRAAATLPSHTRVFNTKERCPTVIHFLSKRGEMHRGSRIDPNLDVAEYMHLFLEVTEEAMEGVTEEEKEQIEAELIEEQSIGEDSLNRSLHSNQRSGTNIWTDDENDEPQTPVGSKAKGNRRVRQLLKESVVTLPSKLSKRLPTRGMKKRKSVVDRQTVVQPMVPILEGSRSHLGEDSGDNASVGDGTVVSVERSSVLFKDTIVYGNLDEGDIDVESIERATSFISGGDSWATKSARMLEDAKKSMSEKAEHVQLEVVSCLAKSNDDLRQEVFVMQMIHYYKSVWAQAGLPLWLKTYRILSTGASTGLLELLTDATSLDGLKKAEGYPKEGGLREYFVQVYGGAKSKAFKAAQTNFVQSLAAYSLVSYLLGLKDRHNGNIMIDTRGHLIFIDFGFALGMAPGHEFSFERAPFKLTKEMVEVMDGVGSPVYQEFERLFLAGFELARKNSQIALGLVEIMMFKSNYPCFTGSRYGHGKALVRFEKRLMLHIPDKKIKRKAKRLIEKSRQHFGTYLYDAFQKATNGYEI